MTDRGDAFRPLDDTERAQATTAGSDPIKAPRSSTRPRSSPSIVAGGLPESHPELGKPSSKWLYYDNQGAVLAAVFRFEKGVGHKEFKVLSRSQTDGAWRWKAPPKPRPLYGLDRLAAHPNKPVLLVEGEKTADAAQTLFPDFVPVTWMNGAQSTGAVDLAPLKERDVVIWPDNDAAGRSAAVRLKTSLEKVGVRSARIVDLPSGLPEGWDLADELPPGIDLMAAICEIDNGSTAADSIEGASNFRMEPDGLYFIRDEAALRVAGKFEVVAETRSAEGDNWGILLSWSDNDGRDHAWAMPRALLAGDGAEIRRALLDGGLYLNPTRRGRDLLLQFLSEVVVDPRVRAVSRIGWHGEQFVLPDQAFGGNARDKIVLQSDRQAEDPLSVSGSLDEWKTQVAKAGEKNFAVAFAIMVALAAPLLQLMGREGGGFHFRGPSSIGKTTLLRVGGSVWGGGGIRGYITQWRMTDNGLEAIAADHCDILLVLDELSQVEPKVAAATAYMLANGTGKGRATRDGGARRKAQWRLLFLSSGEIALSDKISEDGRSKTRAGQEVRVIDVEADAGAGLGVFNDVTGYAKSASEAADLLRSSTDKCYGTAGRSFLRHLVQDLPAAARKVNEVVGAFLAEVCPKGADGQVKRVADRFALVAAAGELAIGFGLLPWKPDTAKVHARVVFDRWLKSRGHTGAAEEETAVHQVAMFIEQHGESRFQKWDGDELRPINNRVGFRKHLFNGGFDYYVFAKMWSSEVCKGLDPKFVTRVLKERGLLQLGSDGKPQVVASPPQVGQSGRYYVVKGDILGERADVQGALASPRV